MGVVQLTTVTAINMMGSGIILLPATLAEIGTVSIFSWILASIGATILAYAFAKCGMYSKKVGGMGGYAEYRFGRLGNFLSNYTYAISLIIANVAIATGVVSYGSYVFGFDLSPMEVCLATIGTLAIAASISLVGPKKFGKFTSLGMICILLPVIGLLLCGWYFFSPNIYVAAWNPHDMPFYLTMRDSIAVILWAFLGLETACANSDTVENPEKNVPVAVLAGTMIAGVCYMTSTAIIGGLVPHTELVSAGAPFGLAYAAMFGNTVGHMVSAMLVVSCFVSLTAWQFTISEVVREAATIGHFPSYLRKVNRFYAPYMAIGTPGLYPVHTDAVYNQPLSVKAVQCPYQSCRHGQSHSLPACHGCRSRSAESRRHLCSKSKIAEHGSYHRRCIQRIRGIRLRMGHHPLRDARYRLRHHDLYAENSPAVPCRIPNLSAQKITFQLQASAGRFFTARHPR